MNISLVNTKHEYQKCLLFYKHLTNLVNFRRFFEIINVPEEEEGKLEVGKLKGDIVFDSVTFRYVENENVFENFSFLS